MQNVIMNLTQHAATPAQIDAGVIDLVGDAHATLKGLLTFAGLPTKGEVELCAYAIANLAAAQHEQYYSFHGQDPADFELDVMIGGAPYLMAPLVKAIEEVGGKALFAFSERVSAEVTNEDGSVRKVNVFKHMGFVEA